MQYLDPFGNTTTVQYDAHALVATTTIDARNNTTSVQLDYRTGAKVPIEGPLRARLEHHLEPAPTAGQGRIP